jgi:hypothetical protein
VHKKLVAISDLANVQTVYNTLLEKAAEKLEISLVSNWFDYFKPAWTFFF